MDTVNSIRDILNAIYLLHMHTYAGYAGYAHAPICMTDNRRFFNQR